MSGDRLLREMDPLSDEYKKRQKEVWARIQALDQAAAAKKKASAPVEAQPPHEKTDSPPVGWMAEHEARQDNLEDNLREAFNRLSKKPSKPESNDTG